MRVRWDRKIPARDDYERDDRESELQIASLKAMNKRRRAGRAKESSSKLSASDLRQAIKLGTKIAESEALFMSAMKARQVAELDRQRPRLVWDRDRHIE
jgi:hypothetical protein